MKPKPKQQVTVKFNEREQFAALQKAAKAESRPLANMARVLIAEALAARAAKAA